MSEMIDLQDAMTRLHLSAAELAIECDVHYITAWRWATGKSNPDPRSVRKIQSMLDRLEKKRGKAT